MANSNTVVRTRKRQRGPVTQAGTNSSYSSSSTKPGEVSVLTTTYNIRLRTVVEECADVNNALELRLSKLAGSLADIGGPLTIRRAIYEHRPAWITLTRGEMGEPGGNWGHTRYTGALTCTAFNCSTAPSLPANNFATLPSASLVNTVAKGPVGWARYSPTNPQGSLSQFLGELRDLPTNPLTMMKRAKSFKDIGSNYLNWEFGWKPFVKDLQDMLLAYLQFDKRLAQLRRDNGKRVKREGPIDREEVTVTESSLVSPNQYSYWTWPGFASYCYPNGSREYRTQVTTVKTRYWFSGEFTYFLAPEGSLKYYEQINRIIYGFDLSPKLVWDLTPWSWLIDWFTTISESIQNMVTIAADSLVARYAYCMGSYISDTITTVTRPLYLKTPLIGVYPGSTATTLTPSFSERYEVKKRTQATPYGFGLDVNQLTSRQLAILAALGLARV